MKEVKTLEKKYDLNIKLHTLYELIDALYNPLENDFPPDVKKRIEDLIDSINNYLYHPIDGYDIVAETYYTKINYRGN